MFGRFKASFGQVPSLSTARGTRMIKPSEISSYGIIKLQTSMFVGNPSYASRPLLA